ncbi:MAG: hypothetical protein V7760_05240 [Marinobacter sp.]
MDANELVRDITAQAVYDKEVTRYKAMIVDRSFVGSLSRDSMGYNLPWIPDLMCWLSKPFRLMNMGWAR